MLYKTSYYRTFQETISPVGHRSLKKCSPIVDIQVQKLHKPETAISSLVGVESRK